MEIHIVIRISGSSYSIEKVFEHKEHAEDYLLQNYEDSEIKRTFVIITKEVL